MKFFKHFVDAHRGKSMQLLMKKYGPAGVGRYWYFVELCAEKLTKEKDEEYTEAHCVFEFEMAYLMRCLAYGNLKQCSTYLRGLSDLGLCSVEEVNDVYVTSMPKLLECMDRDSKRARIERGAGAPKNKSKKKNKSKSDPQTSDELFSSLPPKLIEGFHKKYAEAWVKEQIDLCFNHYFFGDKKVRSWSQTVSGWIGRAHNPVLKINGERIGTMCGMADV